jgi:hypothetical protein
VVLVVIAAAAAAAAVVIIGYLQTVFLEYVMLQLFCHYNV